MGNDNMKYRSRWVCFECCKSFSRIKDTCNHKNSLKCNECNHTMVDMGRFFPAPRRRDRKKWKIMRLLARYKYRFDDPLQKDHIEIFITGKYKLTLKQVEDNIRNDME